jgi:hypothetical protein
MRRSIAREIPILAFLAAATFFLTWPVARHAPNRLPSDLGDPLWHCWVLAWNYETLYQGQWERFWDTNYLHPRKNVLARSADHSALIALLGAPVYLAFDNLLLEYNFLFLLSFFLTAYATYRLALYLTGSRAASLFAGIAFGFSTYRFDHLGHLNLLQTQWIPFIFLFLFLLLRNPRPIYAVGLGAALIANGLSTIYYLVFASLVFVFVFPLALAGSVHWKNRRLWMLLVPTGLVVLAVILPFLLPYAKTAAAEGLERSRDYVNVLSARFSSYWRGPALQRRYALWLSVPYLPEINLFPGFLTYALALACLVYPRNLRALGRWVWGMLRPEAGSKWKAIPSWLAAFAAALILLLVVMRKLGAPIPAYRIAYCVEFFVVVFIVACVLQHRTSRGLFRRYLLPTRSYRGLLFAMAAVVVVLSFGPDIEFPLERPVEAPYSLLYEHVPGFGSLRGIARIGVFAILGFVLLAAYGFADFERAFSARPALLWSARTLLIAGVLVESWSLPVPTLETPQREQFADVYQWLNDQPKETVIVEIPMGDLFDDASYVNRSTLHWKTLVNGYGSFRPEAYMERAARFNTFPSPESLSELRASGADLLIDHRVPPTPLPDSQAETTGRFRVVRRFESATVYELMED